MIRNSLTSFPRLTPFINSVSIGGADAKALERVRVYYTVYGLFRNPPGEGLRPLQKPRFGCL